MRTYRIFNTSHYETRVYRVETTEEDGVIVERYEYLGLESDPEALFPRSAQTIIREEEKRLKFFENL